MSTARATSVAVVGGGLAGLTAAVVLARAGAQVRMWRKNPGRVQTRRPNPELPGWRIETGAPSVTHRASSVFRLAELLGVGAPGTEGSGWRQMAPLARDRYVADGDRLRPVGVGTLGLRQAAEFGRGMMRHRPPAREETVADWARLQFGPAIANGLARAMTVGIWGCAPEHLGFADAWPELYTGLQTTSPMGLQARSAGQRSAVPSGTWTFAEGMGSLGTMARDAFLQARGVLVEEPVMSLSEIDADAIVVATDPTDAAELVEGAETRELLLQVPHSPMAIVHWLAEPQERPRGFGMLVPPPDPVLGTLFMSDLRDEPGSPWAPAGLRSFTTMLGGYANPGWVDRPDTELIAEVVARHARWFGSTPALAAAHVVRWPRAVSIPSPGHRARVAAIVAAGQQGARPLTYAGGWTAGGTLDDAVASGFLAARSVLGEGT